MTAPKRHWRSYGDEGNARIGCCIASTGVGSGSWFLLIMCDHCGKTVMHNERPRMPNPAKPYTTLCTDRSKPRARWGSFDSRHPRNVRRCGNNRHDDVAALNTGSESACMHNTDGRRGDAVAYQLATHDIGTIGCRLGCLTSFIVAASLDYNNCAAPGVSSSSGYDFSCHRRQCRAPGKKEHGSAGQPGLFVQGLQSDGLQLGCCRIGW